MPKHPLRLARGDGAALRMGDVIVVIGPGSIGQAIARRVRGKHILLADLRLENGDAAAKVISEAGFHRIRPPKLGENW